ncbi:SMP-30/gluconolactonase/LRE family protein [Cryobacterium suzukii]|nr:SMP-30/gluconolactonase/LRE family protein [Cryobacterium suzukii]
MQQVEMTLFAEDLAFPEGPVVLEDGSLMICEIKSQSVTRITADGQKTVLAQLHGAPNGAAFGPDGRLWVCDNGRFSWIREGDWDAPAAETRDYTGGGIIALDLDTGIVEEVYRECDGRPLLGPNDIVFDKFGGFYFTDHGKRRARDLDCGALYYAKADGSEIKEVAFPLTTPNGVGLSPDGKLVYVAETDTGHLLSWAIRDPGVVVQESRRGPAGSSVVHALKQYQLCDSLAIEANGYICIASLISGGISVISAEGDLVEFHPVPVDDSFVTNICFGGPDNRTAYITSSGTGRVYSAIWPRPGLPLAH